MWREIKIVESKDLDQVSALLDIEREAFGEKAWNLEMIKSEFQKHNNVILLLRKDQSEIGYVLMRRILDEGELLRIAIRPAFQKMGYGKYLLESLFKKAKSQRIRKIYLEVSEKNIGAVRLYQKVGFQKIGLRKHYYGLNESAYIMVYPLKEEEKDDQNSH